jgi:hypothetical protein
MEFEMIFSLTLPWMNMNRNVSENLEKKKSFSETAVKAQFSEYASQNAFPGA